MTGATGFIGRHLLARLLERGHEVHALARRQSVGKLEELADRLGASGQVKPVVGDLGKPRLGIRRAWLRDHEGSVEHAW